MKEISTQYSKVQVGTQEELFHRMVEILEISAATNGNPFTIGLTGGSTPKAFYKWAKEESAISDVIRSQAVWTVSDERMVPLDDTESNFGTADRELLQPLGVPPERKFPWPVQVDPHSAALAYERRFHERYGDRRTFDVCFLGMGEDGHTASIFKDSPLLVIESGSHFAPVHVPDKGWRLSITPDGLAACGRVVIVVTGAAKAARLKEVLEGPEEQYPVQILSRLAYKVEWLIDEAAATELKG